MSIKKLLLLTSMALAAVAFAVPATAQATITLKDGGIALKKGAKVTATSLATNPLQTHVEETGTLACEKVTLHFEVVTNGHNNVILKQLGEAATAGCNLFSLSTLPATITDGTVGGPEENLKINTWGHGSVASTFTAHIYASHEKHTENMPAQTCHYTGSVTAQVTDDEGDVINVPGSALTETVGACQKATITGELTLETSDGTPVTVDFVDTTP